MMAGQFSEPIKVYDIQESTNEFGEVESVYQYHCSTRAKIDTTTGSRTNENDEIFYTHNKVIYVRSYVPVHDKSMIEYDSKRYRVINIENRKDYNDKVINLELINE